MPRTEFDVLIVGGGIAGGALAAELSATALRVGLVEAGALCTTQSAAATTSAGFDSRVSALTPASTQRLADLGAWQRIAQEHSCPFRQMAVWDAQGTGSVTFSAAELDAERLGTIVENRRLTAALMDTVVQGARVELFADAQVEQLQQHESQREVLLRDGRTLRARLLVAADGAVSPLRTLAGFVTREWDYGHCAVVCTVETTLAHGNTAYQRFLTSGPLAFLPLPSLDGRHYCSIVWSLLDADAADIAALSDAAFRQELESAIESRLGTVLDVSDRVSFPLRQRHAVDYVQPGLALVGDAAHTIHPLAGQGINLGLQDVRVLAQEIRRAHARGLEPGSMEVLRRYQRRRKGENLAMMAAMDGFKRLFGSQELPVRWLRNSGMRLFDRSGIVKQRIMRHAMGIR
jgi:2-octaprenylphenol hydroxylase